MIFRRIEICHSRHQPLELVKVGKIVLSPFFKELTRAFLCYNLSESLQEFLEISKGHLTNERHKFRLTTKMGSVRLENFAGVLSILLIR
jgi:hypothetical protein